MVDLPRTRLVGTLLKDKGGQIETFRNNFCVINFNVTKHVLDIVYSQTICWLTLFYAPLITVVTLLKLLMLYYLRIFYVNYVRNFNFWDFLFEDVKKIQFTDLYTFQCAIHCHQSCNHFQIRTSGSSEHFDCSCGFFHFGSYCK